MFSRFTEKAIQSIMLAQEEAKHKLRFEIEYDEEVLRENQFANDELQHVEQTKENII